jgi:hypothetical protein
LFFPYMFLLFDKRNLFCGNLKTVTGLLCYKFAV